jgi:hypothetical protein
MGTIPVQRTDFKSAPLILLAQLCFAVSRVAVKSSGRREFAQFVANHIFGHKDRNEFPLCTAKVCPINSGVTVERRDHVLMTVLLPADSCLLTFSRRLSSMYAPFLIERATF